MVDAATTVEGNGLDAASRARSPTSLPTFSADSLLLVVVPLNSASRVEAETDAGLEGALAHELTDLLGSLLVAGGRALELGLEGGGGDEGVTLGVVDEQGLDVGVRTHDAQARTGGGAEELAADTALTTLEAGALCLLLVHVKLLKKSCQHLTGCWSYDVTRR